MRLSEIERGEKPSTRLLIGFISMMSGMRLPDAARVAFYHKDFFSGPMGAWTQAAMRGASEWTIGERELMAAMIAHWNACPFCVGAHGAIAAKQMTREVVSATLDDYRKSAISEELRATLSFLEKLTKTPGALTAEDAGDVLRADVSPDALEDAAAVAAVFAIVTRYANALSFTVPSPVEFDRAGDMLLKRGYGSR